eukprot:CAMPEP_0176231622 /NCGR_PEP_ID=MMETSP0121_2-20121125/24893_1 /TAXON_ID=160619 /ORGANISM="Kryptoperidinium foliaceum, Strain CCMP 1326" /LENGTH=76 /DNA_ID=CAMNT_0017570969 /DNA_START=16 /DNA_END=243 /DNA_ORIENTATION=+
MASRRQGRRASPADESRHADRRRAEEEVEKEEEEECAACCARPGAPPQRSSRLAEVEPGEGGALAELLLDAQQLVV